MTILWKKIDLCEALGELGIWVRLHYVYPYPHVSNVIPLMADGKILPYIDIPFQHAAPDVLKNMRRPGTQDKTLAQIDPDLDQEEPRNDDGTISITLFDEQVKITYPLHTLDGYIEAAKKAGLTFDIERRYCGLEADRSKNGKNNSLCFAAALKR